MPSSSLKDSRLLDTHSIVKRSYAKALSIYIPVGQNKVAYGSRKQLRYLAYFRFGMSYRTTYLSSCSPCFSSAIQFTSLFHLKDQLSYHHSVFIYVRSIVKLLLTPPYISAFRKKGENTHKFLQEAETLLRSLLIWFHLDP